jgi:quercetin dioxygenase-like cupin family protein
MTQQTLPAALALSLATLLLVGCQAPTSQANDRSEVTNTEVLESQARAPQATPPVTGDPAFTRTADAPELDWGLCPEFMPESCRLAVVQGNPAEPNADAFFKLAPGTTVPEHWHTSAERMVLLSGLMEVDYVGQAPVRVEPGTYAYGPAELPHETHCLGVAGDAPCVLFIAFEEPIDAIAGTPDAIPLDEAFTWTADAPDLQWGPCPPFMPEGCELAVLQGDPEGPDADVFFKLAPSTTVPMHWHTSVERMVLVSGEMQVNFQGQSPVTVEPFTYAYGPAELPHETRCGNEGECVLFIAFEEPVDAVPVRGGDLPHRR